MNVNEFVAKWTKNQRSEKSASQEQFLDLCRSFEHPTPNEDATGEDFAFEKGAGRIGGATYRRRVMRDPRQSVSASKFDAKTKQWRPSVEELQQALPRRTMTMLYNERPTWLASAHAALDAAVCNAYGLDANAPDDLVLSHLLALNAERATPAL